MEVERLIQKLHLKKGTLSRELGIPIKRNIPLTVLNAIILNKIGDTIDNPSQLGKRRIKITNRMAEKAIFLKTMSRVKTRDFDKKLDKALEKNAMRNRMVRNQLRKKQKVKKKTESEKVRRRS